jgi:hypothetical protein
VKVINSSLLLACIIALLGLLKKIVDLDSCLAIDGFVPFYFLEHYITSQLSLDTWINFASGKISCKKPIRGQPVILIDRRGCFAVNI